jgi:hypothetical protein
MTLPASGAISLNNVNQELGFASPYQQTVSMNDTALRTLFGVPGSGTTISMSVGYGKSNAITVNITQTGDQGNVNLASLVAAALPGWNSTTQPVIVNYTINSGVAIIAMGLGQYALTVYAFPAGSVINIINNGYICGMGAGGAGETGGPAMALYYPVTITNASGYIFAGGGGGGMGGDNTVQYYTSTGSSGDVWHNIYGGSGGRGAGSISVSGGAYFGGIAGENGWPGDSYASAPGAGGTGSAIGVNGGTGANGTGPNGPGGGGGGGGGGANGGAGGNSVNPAYQWATGGYSAGWTGIGYAGGAGSSHNSAIVTNGNAITWVSGSARCYGGIV